MSELFIRGAKQHNLKNIDVRLPRDKLVVITGVSGSGKSSLAFDTIYAEGQRRYVESLSAYARQFLELMEKPEVDSIEGLSPAISIEQRTVSKNPRSTVATVTEIYDYLRLLFARIGHVFCHKCDRPIQSQTCEQITDRILELESGTRIHIMAPIVRGRKGRLVRELAKLKRQGFTRIKLDGEYRELSDDIEVSHAQAHSLSAVVDRLVVKDSIRSRLNDSVETALRLADGVMAVEIVQKAGSKKKLEEPEELIFSEKTACPYCGVSYPEIAPRLFSFNSPFGACATCSGIGTKRYFDEALVVPNEQLSVREGAIAPWAHRQSASYFDMLDALATHYEFSIQTPWKKLPKKVQKVLLHGSGADLIAFHDQVGEKRTTSHRPFVGVVPYLEQKYYEVTSDSVLEEIEQFMAFTECPTCKGARLKLEALMVKVGDKNIHEVTQMSIKEVQLFFALLELTEKEEQIAERILREIRSRIGFLMNVGLNYLTLNRNSGTLAGGESQRIRLATQIGSQLVGVLYILDEPSIGLHQRDNRRLLESLERLRDLGNTVLVVEHDEDTIRAADYVVDLGPGAGIHGGEVVAIGTPKQISKHATSLTGKYLSGRMTVDLPTQRRQPGKGELVLKGANGNNLQNLTARFPLGIFICVTGVSGSGKSTLILDTLFQALKQRLYSARDKSAPFKDLSGWQAIDKVIDMDQSPIGRTPRSNPATYTGLFSEIRNLFAMLPEAKVRGFKPGRFSFNVKGGRCEACQGAGSVKIEMHFLPDVYVKCEACRGKRYNRESLEVTYKGKSIFDVLEMTVEEARDFFATVPRIRNRLKVLVEVGMGYIKLGQSATTLSGGEAQRLKLAKELAKRATGRTLYILDEPTTGLHFDDVRKLSQVLHALVDQGNTVIVIEHNLEIIKGADQIIDLGPEGGDEGGQIVAAGTPEEVAEVSASYTGQFLAEILNSKENSKRPKIADGRKSENPRCR